MAGVRAGEVIELPGSPAKRRQHLAAALGLTEVVTYAEIWDDDPGGRIISIESHAWRWRFHEVGAGRYQLGSMSAPWR